MAQAGNYNLSLALVDGMEGIWALDSSHIYFASGGFRKYVNGVYSTIEY